MYQRPSDESAWYGTIAAEMTVNSTVWKRCDRKYIDSLFPATPAETDTTYTNDTFRKENTANLSRCSKQRTLTDLSSVKDTKSFVEQNSNTMSNISKQDTGHSLINSGPTFDHRLNADQSNVEASEASPFDSPNTSLQYQITHTGMEDLRRPRSAADQLRDLSQTAPSPDKFQRNLVDEEVPVGASKGMLRWRSFVCFLLTYQRCRALSGPEY